MEAEIRNNSKKAEDKMKGSLEFLDDTFARIRAGRANPRILDNIFVDYYGSNTALSGVASISAPDARTIAIQPWEKDMLKPIEKAIINSDLGLNPDNNGEVIRLNLPPMTDERRKDLTKQAKQEAEDAKVGVRNARREAIDFFKKMDKLPEDTAKDLESDMQKLHDKYIKMIDDAYIVKEKEIMTV